MNYRLEFINDPTRVLTHSFKEREDNRFIARIGGMESLKSPVWAVVLDGDKIIAVTQAVQFIFDLAQDIAEKFWTDRGVTVGLNNGTHASRREAFRDVCESYTSERSSYLLWWLLDDIEIQCDRIKDRSCLEAACDYAERKIIEYALGQQEQIDALSHHQTAAGLGAAGVEDLEGSHRGVTSQT